MQCLSLQFHLRRNYPWNARGDIQLWHTILDHYHFYIFLGPRRGPNICPGLRCAGTQFCLRGMFAGLAIYKITLLNPRVCTDFAITLLLQYLEIRFNRAVRTLVSLIFVIDVVSTKRCRRTLIMARAYLDFGRRKSSDGQIGNF